MKIGEFSKKFNVSVATVRHYINLGLLVPQKGGYQYNFTDKECYDMEIISTMKNSGFTLNELAKYLNILRFYNKDDYLLHEKLISVLNLKKESLYKERSQINAYIQMINTKIKEIEMNAPYATSKAEPGGSGGSARLLPGFPVGAIELLSCPHCQSKLRMFNVDISGNGIMKGSLACECGYHASIKEGILYADALMELEHDPAFFSCYFGNENLIKNEDGLVLMGMDEYSNQYLAAIHKASLWIAKELKALDSSSKTILFPDMACQYLYSYYNNAHMEECIFLITALTERTIHTMRHHIANANPNLKVAYIINPNGRLPLKWRCIDTVVDYMGSSNLGFFNKNHYFDLIGPYMAEEATVIGSIEYYKKGSPSTKRIFQLYPHSAPDVCTLEFLCNALRNNAFEIQKLEKILEGYDPGNFFEYHIPGDIRTTMAYLAKRKKKTC